mmetsp:Transcript_12199/g.19265  ORF Transcript_12199/g.19265 Transcript_12199/m.19265 type:complete len:234 (-) Transcript_12199:554-1255(-)
MARLRAANNRLKRSQRLRRAPRSFCISVFFFFFLPKMPARSQLRLRVGFLLRSFFLSLLRRRDALERRMCLGRRRFQPFFTKRRKRFQRVRRARLCLRVTPRLRPPERSERLRICALFWRCIHHKRPRLRDLRTPRVRRRPPFLGGRALGLRRTFLPNLRQYPFFLGARLVSRGFTRRFQVFLRLRSTFTEKKRRFCPSWRVLRGSFFPQNFFPLGLGLATRRPRAPRGAFAE